MKYIIKVNNMYLIGENFTKTISGTRAGDTTAVYSRNVGEMSAYDFTSDKGRAGVFDRVTASDYISEILERQRIGHYKGVIKITDLEYPEPVLLEV